MHWTAELGSTPFKMVSVSSINSLCAGEIGSVCYIWCNSPVLSGVLCEFNYSPFNSLSLLLSLSSRRTWALGPCLRTTWHDDSLLSPVHLVSTVLPVYRTCLWNPERATCPRPAVFNSLETAGVVETLNDQLWKANWHLLLRWWLAAPSTTTVIIIIWPCWSFMNIVAMFCYLRLAQPDEDWPPLIAWFLSRFLPRFWPF